MMTITNKASGLYSNIGELLNNKYIPAVTSVAACNNALTGVGLFVSSNFIYWSDYIIFTFFKMKLHV